jgi:hypothetical protein
VVSRPLNFTVRGRARIGLAPGRPVAKFGADYEFPGYLNFTLGPSRDAVVRSVDLGASGGDDHE